MARNRTSSAEACRLHRRSYNRLAAAAELLAATLADVLLSAAKVAELVGAATGAVATALFGTGANRAVAHQVLAVLALHGFSLSLSLLSTCRSKSSCSILRNPSHHMRYCRAGGIRLKGKALNSRN